MILIPGGGDSGRCSVGCAWDWSVAGGASVARAVDVIARIDSASVVMTDVVNFVRRGMIKLLQNEPAVQRLNARFEFHVECINLARDCIRISGSSGLALNLLWGDSTSATLANSPIRTSSMTPNSPISWHPDEDVTPSPKDVDSMACVLEGRHGQYAAEVAEFFAAFHGQNNDAGRTWAWAGVAEVVRHRERLRLQG